jgi:transposase
VHVVSLVPGALGARVDGAEIVDDVLVLTMSSSSQDAACPICSTRSKRVQSRYTRSLADLPAQGLPVRVALRVRRFYCVNEDCERKVFAERVPDFAPSFARYTARLTSAVRAIGFSAGGEGGARLAARLGIRVSPDTILNRIRSSTPQSTSAPRHIGVDDFAFRRGKRYGTIIVDLERRRPIDLLPDRSSETVAAWLRERPSVEVVTRDRAVAYAEAARLGAPSAIQVADRWHLFSNLGEALERLLARHHKQLKHVAGLIASESLEASTLALSPDLAQDFVSGAQQPFSRAKAERDKAVRRERRLARYNEVIALRASGHGLRDIARRTGLNRRTVWTYVNSGAFPERAQGTRKPSILDPHVEAIDQLLLEGRKTGVAIFAELKARGYRGGKTIVLDYIRRCRPGRSPINSPAHAKSRPPAPRKVAMWLSREAEHLDAEAIAFIERLCREHPEIDRARCLALEFGLLIRERRANALSSWLTAADVSGIAELVAFVRGIRTDITAVEQAVSSEFSNGQTEGQVNRLKVLKRQMYGRAKLDLLRARVLNAA